MDAQMKRKCKRFIVSWLIMFCMTGSILAAEPLRIAIPAAPSAKDNAEEAERVSICLSLYLQESLGGNPAIRLVSELRSRAIINELCGGTYNLEEAQLLPAFSAVTPVDAIVEYKLKDNKVACALYTAAGVRHLEIPFPPKSPLPPLAEAVAQFLVSELKLDAETAAALTARRVEKKDFFEPYYVSQKVKATWISNTGETRLKFIQPYLQKYPDNQLVAARVLNSAHDMIADSRKTKFQKDGLTMAWIALPVVLGTPLEDSAYKILQSNPDRFEKDLLAMVAALTKDAIDNSLDETKPGTDVALPGMDAPAEGRSIQQPGGGYYKSNMEQRLGALRCLGVSRSEKALKVMKSCMASEDPQIREAVAVALGYYEKETGLDLLNALAGDKQPAVAFTASYSLMKRGKDSKTLLPLARSLVSNPVYKARAADALSKLGTKEDVPALARLCLDASPEMRSFAAEGLLRIKSADARQTLSFLNDPDEAVVIAALPALNGKQDADIAGRMEILANEPYAIIARTARLALLSQRPPPGRDRDLFDLKTEHNYIRMRIVDKLADNPDEWSLKALGEACLNRDAHTRAYALGKLLERDSALGRQALAKAIMDPHEWVRLHAAALLAGIATASETEAIRKAASREKDEAIGLYLADALAKSEGKPLPEPRSSVHSVGGQKNLVWYCGNGDAEKPVADAYYTCGVPLDPTETGKRNYKSGKIIIPRVNTVGNPCDLISDPAWQDRFWLTIKTQLTPKTLPWCDGVVYGEESMSADIQAMWGNGWPLFCWDAGIDPERVKGDRKNLSTYEERAWKHWAQGKFVEGFNILYDYTKLYYGKLRPGFIVETYLPGQGGVTPADKRWKFDVGGCYWYDGSNREMYTYIRRFKTLWPDRPINWLANGCTHLYGNLNAGTSPKYTAAYPKEFIVERWERPYADNISAWLAGADSGWFGGFGATVEKKDEPIFGVSPEEMYSGCLILEQAMTKYAAYVETLYRAEGEKVEAPKNMTKNMLDDVKASDDTMELDDKKAGEHPAVKRAKEFKARTHLSFLIMGKFVNDCMRVFASLPRLNPNPQALIVHPHDWPGGLRFNAPGLILLNAYDYLPDLNQAANDLDLGRYRVIALSSLNEFPIMDSTIERITRWLKEQPGILYVHGTLSPDNSNEASTIKDFDGVLQNNWPWEKDVELVASNYRVSGENAKTLASDASGPVRVLWRSKDFKGAVIFDMLKDDAGDLRKTMNSMHAENKTGLDLNGPAGQVIWQENGLLAANSYDSKENNSLKGVDLLTGEANPKIGPGRNSAIVAHDYTGKYIAAWNGVSILCDQPIKSVTAVEGGLKVECPGLIRAGAETGAATAKRGDGSELPTISGIVNITEWILSGDKEGQASLPIGNTGSSATFVRCKQAAVIIQK
jgi:HEAT repeat protein